MTEFTAKLGNLNMNVRREGHEGQNPALLFLHAGIADSRLWTPQINAFKSDYDVIAPDLRGFGKTMPVDESFAYYQDITSLLDALNIGQAFVVGCSFGGAVALDLALNAPERVTGLCLVCAAIAGFKWSGEMPAVAARIDAACEAGDIDLCNELELDRWVVGEGRSRAAVSETVLTLVRDMNRTALTMPERGSEEEPKPDAIERLGDIDVPTLVIGAEFDDPVSKARTEILSREIKTATTHWIKSAGHLPSLEQPDAFNNLLKNFLSGDTSP